MTNKEHDIEISVLEQSTSEDGAASVLILVELVTSLRESDPEFLQASVVNFLREKGWYQTDEKGKKIDKNQVYAIIDVKGKAREKRPGEILPTPSLMSLDASRPKAKVGWTEYLQAFEAILSVIDPSDKDSVLIRFMYPIMALTLPAATGVKTILKKYNTREEALKAAEEFKASKAKR